jgi:acyl-CoA reductase-like NAD-dependent aldehyde dehydrogenase
MMPAVLYPVTLDMKVYHEEQFGPIIPAATYDDLDNVLRFGHEGQFGQQVSIFDQDADQTSRLVDSSAVFARINIIGKSSALFWGLAKNVVRCVSNREKQTDRQWPRGRK